MFCITAFYMVIALAHRGLRCLCAIKHPNNTNNYPQNVSGSIKSSPLLIESRTLFQTYAAWFCFPHLHYFPVCVEPETSVREFHLRPVPPCSFDSSCTIGHASSSQLKQVPTWNFSCALTPAHNSKKIKSSLISLERREGIQTEQNTETIHYWMAYCLSFILDVSLHSQLLRKNGAGHGYAPNSLAWNM